MDTGHIKPSFTSFLSTLLAVHLLVICVSTQTTSPTSPRRPIIRNESYPPAANGALTGDRRKSGVRDPITWEERARLVRERNIERLKTGDWLRVRPDGVGLTGTTRSQQDLKSQVQESRPPEQKKINFNRRGVTTIPHWSDSFTYQELTYKYTMVGTDPKRGSATTVIPTVIIPIRWVFEDGTVFDASTDLVDGETSIHGIINSPIFRPRDYNVGGINVGNTQFGDAFQRANFWNLVSRRSPDYHVLLGEPTVAPTVDVFVPNNKVIWFTDGTSLLRLHPLIDNDLLLQATYDAIRQANVSTQTLPIVDWGNAEAIGDRVFPYHGAYEVPGGVQTYVSAGYQSREGPADCANYGTCRTFDRDIYLLSGAILEWLNNPFADNYTPGWNPPFDADVPPQSPCYSRHASVPSLYTAADKLEVRKPLWQFYEVGVPVNTDAGTYHVADAVFLDYFTRASPSRSAGGRYIFWQYQYDDPSPDPPFELPNLPSSSCVGHVEVEFTQFEFPGAISTTARGINNRGLIVGTFDSESDNGHGFRHGFIYDGANFTQLDHPNAVYGTVASGLNDAGRIVGWYWDRYGYPHGFLYFDGSFTPIDFPGSFYGATLARGINNRGDIVGVYDGFLEIAHGFIYQNGEYRTLDTPFGQQTDVRGINDRGEVVGLALNDPFVNFVYYDPWFTPFEGPSYSFWLDKDGFKQFPTIGYGWPDDSQSPWTVNKRGMIGGRWGYAFDVFYAEGFVTIYGYPYLVNSDAVFGMNDKGQIVGSIKVGPTIDDPNLQPRAGYVATLPK
ncbi:MAG: hypothetical protein ACT4OT_02790 [Acidobacteriota bacterium]